MCLAVPGRVLSIDEVDGTPMAEVDFGGVRKESAWSTSRTSRSATTSSSTSGSRSSGSTSSRPWRRSPTSSGWGSWRRSSATASPWPPGRPASTKGDTMKYLDEFSDPDLARKLLDQIHAVTTRPWAMMEVCGGQTHSIIRHGIDQLLPDGRRDDPRTGLPGLRHPAGDDRQGARDRRAARRDLLLVRRHAAGAGQRPGPVLGQERGRRRTRRLLPARRAEARPGEPGPAGRLLRHRLRDHRAGQRDDGLPGQAARGQNFSLLVSHVLVPPAIAAIMESPTLPGAGLPRRRPRVQRDGHGRVPAAGRAVPRADRRHRLRAAGHPRGHPAHGGPARDGPARGARTPTPAPCAPRATRPRWRCCATSSRSPTAPGAASG